MRYIALKRNSVQFLSLTGLSIENFDVLLSFFSEDWDNYITHYTIDGDPRIRLARISVCKQLPITADKLLFILIYLKTNPLQEYHAAYFGMTQPKANKFIHLLSSVLLSTLKRIGELPERNVYRLKEQLKSFTDVLLDGTERPIQRPQAEDLQKACYSGKKNS
jgi:hypothetical protein